MPEEPFARLFTWMGYFGAELAKTVPFVDWSEVFHVANGSPLQAQTALGAQIAFVLRAGLDLLLLAAVLQAVQIATRLREQESAFRNSRLPILEPFTERVELARVFEQINEDLDFRPSAQPAILEMPPYDATRLRELIDGTAETKNIKVAKAAAALLQKDYEAAPDSNPDTPRFWTERVVAEKDLGYRSWLMHVASGVDLDDPSRMQDAQRRSRLIQLIQEDWTLPRARSQAIRQLGRSELNPVECDTLLGLLKTDRDLEVQAAAAVALAKAGIDEAFPSIEALIVDLPDDAVISSQAIAFALAHRGDPIEEIEGRFAEVLRPHTQAAARIQRTPTKMEFGCQTTDSHSLRNQPEGGWHNELIFIFPGKGKFPAEFPMGPSAHPETVPMQRNFAIGRWPVRNVEMSSFYKAVNREMPGEAKFHGSNHPTVNVTWYDAAQYCEWISIITGELYALPTESEWEYCCRSGSTAQFYWGDDAFRQELVSSSLDRGQFPEVGKYPPNNWGIYDMHGTVFEWCRDPWQAFGATSPDFSCRSIRGGSWNDIWEGARASYRAAGVPNVRRNTFGFRLARYTSITHDLVS